MRSNPRLWWNVGFIPKVFDKIWPSVVNIDLHMRALITDLQNHIQTG
jgi:hypothetical protein